MSLEKCLLCGTSIGTMIGSPAPHRAHLEHLQLHAFAAQYRPGFVPIHLCFRAPRIRLRHEYFAPFQSHLLPLAAEPFELAEISFPTVDGLRCVRVRTNRYSVPLRPGTKVEARVNADSVELWHEGRRVVRHERCYSRQQQVLDLEHYLDVLERKPGALAGSTALAQWRQAGRWTESFDRLWQELNMRHGRQHGTRQMIELLQLGTGDGWSRLRSAVEQALTLGCHDVAAIRHLMLAEHFDRPLVAAIDIGALARYERPMPVMSGYDQLLSHTELAEVPA